MEQDSFDLDFRPELDFSSQDKLPIYIQIIAAGFSDSYIELEFDSIVNQVYIVDRRARLDVKVFDVSGGRCQVSWRDLMLAEEAGDLRAWTYEIWVRTDIGIRRARWPDCIDTRPLIAGGRRFLPYKYTRSNFAALRSLRHPGSATQRENQSRAPSGGVRKIVFLVRQVSAGAGQTTAVIGIANMLASVGHNVCIAALYHDERPALLPIRADVIFDFIDGSVRSFDGAKKDQLLSNVNVARIKDYLSRLDADVVYVPAYDGDLFRIVVGATARGIKLILGDHLGSRHDQIARGAVPKDYQYALAHFDAVHIVNGIMEAPLRRIFKKPILTIENAQLREMPPVQALRKRKQVLCLGRLSERKGTDVVVSSFAKIAHLYPDWSLVVAGRGEDKFLRKLKTIASSIDRGRIRFVGFTAEPEKLLSESSVLASASKVESFGLSVLEGMSAGCIIVSYCGHMGAQLLLNENNSLLAEHLDVASFENKLEQAIQMANDPFGVACDLRRAALETAKNYSYQSVAQKWERAIHDLCEKRPI